MNSLLLRNIEAAETRILNSEKARREALQAAYPEGSEVQFIKNHRQRVPSKGKVLHWRSCGTAVVEMSAPHRRQGYTNVRVYWRDIYKVAQ